MSTTAPSEGPPIDLDALRVMLGGDDGLVKMILEKFRVASNLAYDLFNNGLGNRRNQFGSFFGWAPYTRGGMTNSQFEEAERKLEPVITRIIIDAAKEQGIS